MPAMSHEKRGFIEAEDEHGRGVYLGDWPRRPDGLWESVLRGDLSLVFPIMRGMAPLLTAIVAMLFLGQHLTPLAWIGVIAATGAVIAFALPPRGVLLHQHPDRAALLWAVAPMSVTFAVYWGSHTSR